jgi:hypothetical protein
MTKICCFSRALSVTLLVTAGVGYILPPMSAYATVSSVSAGSAAVAVIGDVDAPRALLT